MLAPICLFTYNRLEKTKQTINALKKNFLANQSHLIIFSDGAKDYKTKHEVNSVRRFLYTIDGFKSVEIIESPINQGLGESITNGVTKVIDNYGKVIVLEDDLYTTPNFLDYMNQASRRLYQRFLFIRPSFFMGLGHMAGSLAKHRLGRPGLGDLQKG